MDVAKNMADVVLIADRISSEVMLVTKNDPSQIGVLETPNRVNSLVVERLVGPDNRTFRPAVRFG